MSSVKGEAKKKGRKRTRENNPTYQCFDEFCADTESILRSVSTAVRFTSAAMGVSPKDNEDSIQEVYEKLLKAWHRVPSKRGQKAFINTVVTNAFTDRFRHQGRLPLFCSFDSLLENGVLEKLVCVPDSESRQCVEQQIDVLLLIEDLFQGSPEEKQMAEIVCLHDLEGLSYREIAAIMPVGRTRVGILYRRAIDKLRISLGQLSDEQAA